MSKTRRAREPVTVDVTLSKRDFVMARLLAARQLLAQSIAAIDEATDNFIDVEDDPKAKDRRELIETALETTGMASRALESAESVMPDVDPAEIEPWDDGDEDDK